ncbi:PREDICTED: nascent polypeptide-associated complex subunit alpha, muscle-specific form-like [Nipponia nippon]|uniref:nascent polypeptide-associated complex subunit alpha, muscle-specific form-like n=1 Tax=Nipponia nippon TaxID=128390 RepID=UPI000510AB34|nr:PREDICTED: nascent polypeptide-associated complex subunit alpha, muscle-specific form-like [Nipponia nippon]
MHLSDGTLLDLSGSQRSREASPQHPGAPQVPAYHGRLRANEEHRYCTEQPGRRGEDSLLHGEEMAGVQRQGLWQRGYSEVAHSLCSEEEGQLRPWLSHRLPPRPAPSAALGGFCPPSAEEEEEGQLRPWLSHRLPSSPALSAALGAAQGCGAGSPCPGQFTTLSNKLPTELERRARDGRGNPQTPSPEPALAPSPRARPPALPGADASPAAPPAPAAAPRPYGIASAAQRQAARVAVPPAPRAGRIKPPPIAAGAPDRSGAPLPRDAWKRRGAAAPGPCLQGNCQATRFPKPRGRTSLPGQQHRGARTLHGLGFAPAQLLVYAELFNGNTDPPHLPPSFVLAKGSETFRCREV